MALAQINTDTSLVTTEDIPWAELMPGVELKFLRVGGPSGTYTIITRFAPGIELPKHWHFGEVHAHTISGRWGYREYGWLAEAGSYAYEPVGSIHTLFTPEDNSEQTVVLFVIDKGMALLDENDQPFHIEDAHGLYKLYLDALEAAGIPAPPGVLP